jgi:Lamin Tail Domain
LNRLARFTVAALAFFVPAAPAAIRIAKVYFDSPGADYGSNKSLNAEWVKLKNTGSTAKALTGWTIRDGYGWTYRFGTYKLGAGKTVTVHTGNGSNTAGHRYWDHGGYIWNNDGDTAKLRNKAGKLIDMCSFSGAGDYKVC